ncbi:tetratricopeptide (TPR) repeat protein [Croceifilum oryzae]|uniref:Tetratricopeptide (TPR) repeat protein n=1 Tax=Croceifilum oryzae TaxID=1553429 RepID=A0AAJ1TGU1_9BACL|nr:tetratricopeptide repeat protein [Croceifilum oryzae]MDQ0418608.1 tetratricopeptide (TPR) repeat protein [Croceifilum oryzae]
MLVLVNDRLAQAIKKARIAREMHQDDVSIETGISTSHLYNIEKGYHRVDRDKLQKVCDLFKLHLENFLSEEIAPIELDISQYIKLIEWELTQNPSKAMEHLRQIESQQVHLFGKNVILEMFASYIRAKHSKMNEQYDLAIKYYNAVIKIATESGEPLHHNMISSSYFGISQILHRQNKLLQALQVVQLGIQHFVPDGERSYNYVLFRINQASILEKMDRDNEALNLIEKYWTDRSYLDFSDARLNLYQIKTEILIKQERFQEAVDIAQEGFELARLDGNVDRVFEFLSSIGYSFARLGNLQIAKVYFEEANQLQSKLKRKVLASTTYIHLAKIYSLQERFEDAKQHLEIALTLSQSDDYYYAKALTAMGEAHYHQEKMESALQYLDSAWRIATRLNLDNMVRHTLTLLLDISHRSKISIHEEYLESFRSSFIKPTVQGGIGMFGFVNDPPDN